jgi:uncharacterized peroxidase-related enzyme
MANLKLEEEITSDISKGIIEKTRNAMGFAPNMYIKMGHNAALLDAYTYAYNSFRANSGFTPIEQEVIFLSVAYENNCGYCMSAHSFAADMMSKVPTGVTDAIRDGKEIADSKLNALSRLTRLLTANAGHVTKEETDNFLAAGYTESAVLGIIAGIGVKTMSNYSNHNTSPEVDAAFAGRAWKNLAKENTAYLIINAIPNPENMEGFELYLSKIMPIFTAKGGVKIERHKNVEQVLGNSGIKLSGIFEFPDAQTIKDMIAGEEFNSLGALRAESFIQLDLFISKTF